MRRLIVLNLVVALADPVDLWKRVAVFFDSSKPIVRPSVALWGSGVGDRKSEIYGPSGDSKNVAVCCQLMFR